MALNRLKSALWLAAVSAAALGAPGPAHAQFYFDTWGGRFNVPLEDPYDRDYDRRPYRDAATISRAEVISMLNRRGYRVDPSIARNADVYLVEAVDPSGRRVRLTVDAFDGAILRRVDVSAPPRNASRWDDDDRFNDDRFMRGDEPPVGAPPRVIPGVGPAQRKPAPKKPATARVEPRAAAPKPTTAPPPAPVPAAPPTTAPAPAAPGPAAAAQEPAAAQAAGPRVIPLYKTPAQGAAPADKPAEGAP